MKNSTFWPRVSLLLATSLLAAACTLAPVPASTPPAVTLTAFAPAEPTPQSPTLAPPAVPTAPAAEPASPVPTEPPPTTSPSPEPPMATVRFAVIGDYGLAGPAEAAVANLVISWAPDLIITTGDNNYPSGSADTIDANVGQYFHDYIAPYLGTYGPGAETNRFFPSPGNHDWDTPGLAPYLDYFTLPGNERYYDFVWGPVHFFALDGDSREPDGVGRSSVQALWLQDALARSDAPWKVVYSHFPPYSSGWHGSVEWMRWPFKEWGASVYLAGHDHVYERLVVDDLPYLTNGLGGNGRYIFTIPLPGSIVRFNDDFGALLVEASPEEMVFQFITVGGEVIDTFRMGPGGS